MSESQKKGEERATIGVVVPVELRDILQERADSSYRSLSKYCAMVLTNHVEQSRTLVDKEPVEHSATLFADLPVLPDEC